jgi:glycosyltransferase involved in cell wall biosynthesis
MNAPLHIGLLTPALAGVTGLDSGIGVHFRHLAEALVAAGHRVTVVVVTEKNTVPPTGLAFAVRIIEIRPAVAARVVGRMHWQLHQWTCVRAGIAAAARAVRELDVDIWETTSTGSLALDFLGLRPRAPVVTRVSTTAAQLRATNAGPITWVGRRIETWERTAILRSDRVFTHSLSHRAALAAAFSLAPETIAIVPHGIPVPANTPLRSASNPKCEILFVGRLEHRKGIDLLLAALPAMLQAEPDATVTLVGTDRDGHWQKMWRQSAPAVVRDRVSFAGVVDAATLTSHYRNAHVFIAPSRYESFGLIFVEAMAYALPVVALRAPGAIDLIENDVNGVLVSPDDPSALSAALSGLVSDRARRQRLGDAGRRSVEALYSLPALASASVAFYRDRLSVADDT